MPYLRNPQKISGRFSLKSVHVSVSVFSVNSKNLNVGCTARFREIKQEKLVFVTSSKKTIAHTCFSENSGSNTCALQLVSACCLRVKAFGAKSQLCKGFMDWQPLDNTFVSVFKPNNNLATACRISSAH